MIDALTKHFDGVSDASDAHGRNLERARDAGLLPLRDVTIDFGFTFGDED